MCLKAKEHHGTLFSALQDLHFVHCHYERVLLYSKTLNQSKSGLSFIEILFLWVLLLGTARKILQYPAQVVTVSTGSVAKYLFFLYGPSNTVSKLS